MLDAHGVLVTTRRVVCGGATYSVANITSVAVNRTEGSIAWALTGCLFGLFLALCTGMVANWIGVFVGACFMAAGGYGIATRGVTHAVTIRTAGGEAQAFVSANEAEVREVANAVGQAISTR